MKRKPYQLTFIIILLSLAAHMKADVRRLFTGDRLSSSLIDCVVQDKYGYLWIGTEYGLNKFDGYRFTSFLSNPSDTLTINNNEVVKVLSDRDGRLWIGSGKGLSRYDYERNQFVRYAFPDHQVPRVNSLIMTADGDLYIGTAGYGLYQIRKGEDHVTREESFNKRKEDAFYSRIFEDDQHCLWRSSHLNTFTRITIRKGGGGKK